MKDNTLHTLAATDLEPAGARLVMPCFDEPAMKATWYREKEEREREREAHCNRRKVERARARGRRRKSRKSRNNHKRKKKQKGLIHSTLSPGTFWFAALRLFMRSPTARFAILDRSPTADKSFSSNEHLRCLLICFVWWSLSLNLGRLRRPKRMVV